MAGHEVGAHLRFCPTPRAHKQVRPYRWLYAIAYAMGIILLIAQPSFCQKSPARPDASAILQKAMAVSDRLAFTGKQMVTMWLSGRTEATITQEYHQGRSRYRIEYLAPPRVRGRLVISDGKTRWQYEPHSGRTIITPASAPGFSEEFLDVSLALLKSNYRLTLDPQITTVANRKAHAISITPMHPGKPTLKLWIDIAKGLVLKTDRTHSDGTPGSITAYTEIQFRSDLSKELFRFRPPHPDRIVRKSSPRLISSVRSLRQRFGASLVMPERLAAGYRFQNATAQSLRGKNSVQLNYSDGLNTLSFVQVLTRNHRPPARASRTVQIGSQKGWLYSDRHFEILTWHHPSDDLTFSLVGDVRAETLLQIARAIPLTSPTPAMR